MKLNEDEAQIIIDAIQSGEVDALDLQGLIDHPDDWVAQSWTGAAERVRESLGYTMHCTGCGRQGTADDLCIVGDPCPDEECDGTIHAHAPGISCQTCGALYGEMDHSSEPCERIA
jgi:hypothetical protein